MPDSQQKKAAALGDVLAGHLKAPADVFYAVRDVDGKLVAGYWYRVWADERRERWIEFGYLGKSEKEAKRAIREL